MTLFGKKPKVSYESSRLRFISAHIEPLKFSDEFEVVTPHGTFRMTKTQFYSDFPNVVASKSYRIAGYYHYPTIPEKANKYLL